MTIAAASMQAHAMDIKDVVEHTLATNPNVNSSIQEFRSRKYEVDQAKAEWRPDVTFSAGIGHESRKAPVTADRREDFTRRELGLRATQQLYNGFGTRAEVNRQRGRYKSAIWNSYSTHENIALETIDAYLDVLRHSQLLELAIRSEKEHKIIYDQMTRRQDRGVGSAADVDQISARYALANSNVVVARNNLADARANFFRYTALYPRESKMSMPKLTRSVPRTREMATQMALARHPQLESSYEDVKSAVAQYKAAKSRFHPRVRVDAEQRYDKNVGTQGDDDDFIIALRLDYDLYKGGEYKARKLQTAHALEQAKDIRNSTKRQVIESMELSWNAYDALNHQVNYLTQYVDSSARTKSSYGKQFNIGRRTLIDLLNTETEVVEAERALVNAKTDKTFAYYRIQHALGQLIRSLGMTTKIDEIEELEEAEETDDEIELDAQK